MPDIEKQAYDIKSFCKAYSVSRSFAYLEISAGRLKIFKLGRKTLISREAAEAWLKAHEYGEAVETSEAQRPPVDEQRPCPVEREASIKSTSTPPRRKPQVQHRATQPQKSRPKRKRSSPTRYRQSYPTQPVTQQATQVPTRRPKARSPWHLRPLFSDWRNDQRYEQLIDDPDPRLVIYVWRVKDGELVRPHLYKGPLYHELFQDLRVDHGGGKFALMIRRGETMLLAGGFAVAPLPEVRHRLG